MDEHFTPADGLDVWTYARRGEIGPAHHLIRYEWLRRVLADGPALDSILDAGCGAGYGTYLIAKAFPNTAVLGVDYDEDGVNDSRTRYQLPNLSYALGDLTGWEATIGTGTHDAIVSFDSIEHVKHRDLVMESFVRRLRSGGALFLSTPCGAPENNLEPEWAAHQIEFSSASFFDLVSRYFAGVIRPEDEAFPHREAFEELKAAGVDYLLACNPLICREPIRIPNPYRAS
ncbi:MAG: class I SAM-dependent methyltransferase [Thermoanaerobaculia bacterium]